jgi:di/tricarboxylate transporter
VSVEVISILILCGVFLIATVLPIHLGALSVAAAFVFGMFVLEGTFREKVDQIAAGFPGDLFFILAGVTFLFAIARNNGTIEWLVQSAVRLVRGHIFLLPWVMFLVTALLTSVGAVTPAAVAMIAPIGLGLAARYGMSPLLVGLMIVNGATAGSFSPIGIFGTTTNGVVERNNLPGSPLTLFLASFLFNVALAVVSVFVFRNKDRAEQSAVERASAPEAAEPDISLNPMRALTLVCLLALAVGALFFRLDVGFSAFVVAAVLALFDPHGTKGAVNQIAWPTVLLVCGIVTYVSLMENIGTIDFLGREVATIGSPLIAALCLCYIGGVVSAFASTTGLLPALIPLAVPFLQTGSVSAVGLVAALAISSSVVDSSPFSTSGSLVVANAREEEREMVFRRIMQWGFSVVAIAPLVAWLVFVALGSWN